VEKIIPQNTPLKTLQNSYRKNSYTILMVTLLSLRSKDERTATVAKKLFYDMNILTPKELLKLSQEELEKIIKPIGFHKQKAKTLIEVSKILLDKYEGKVPNTKEELLKIKGIGEKTANIILNEVYGLNIIAADTHVHRLVNMWGLIKTKSFEESSKMLNKIIPDEFKNKINPILVAFGQTICLPNNPKCNKCSVNCNIKGYK